MYSLIHHQTCSFEIYSSNFFLLINRCVPLKRTKSHPGSSVRDRISFMPILNNFAASGSVRFTFSQIGTYGFCCSATLLPIKLPLYNMKGWNPGMELHPAVFCYFYIPAAVSAPNHSVLPLIFLCIIHFYLKIGAASITPRLPTIIFLRMSVS